MRYARLLACLLLVFLIAAVGSQLLRRVLPGDHFKHASITQAASGADGTAGAGSALTATERSSGSTTSTTRVKQDGIGGGKAGKSSPSTAQGGSRSATSSGAGAGAAPSHFRTLPPGVSLPSGSQCPAWVRGRPLPERKAVNRPFNRVTGHRVGSSLFDPGATDPRANTRIAARIDGAFTGTTQEILRWTACNWGCSRELGTTTTPSASSKQPFAPATWLRAVAAGSNDLRQSHIARWSTT